MIHETELFEHNGNFYKIEKQKYEPRESHMERVEWIFQRNEFDVNMTEKEFNDLKLLSVIWLNTKKLKCEYSPELMKRIK